MNVDRIGPPIEGIEELYLDGSVSLYHPTFDQVVVLNDTATDVWKLCTGEFALDTIVALLARSYRVDDHEMRQDVAEAVQRFKSAGLLESPAAS